MKASTCSKYSKVVQTWKSKENNILNWIDKRSKSGENVTDDNYVNNHMNITKEGKRCWSF